MAFSVYCVDSIEVAIIDGVTHPDIVSCSSGWVQVVFTPPFDPSQVDPAVIAAMFGAGFSLFITPWAAAWGFTQILNMIRGN